MNENVQLDAQVVINQLAQQVAEQAVTIAMLRAQMAALQKPQEAS